MKRIIQSLAIFLLICLMPMTSFANAESGLGIAPAVQAGTITESSTLTLPEGLSEKAYRITDSLVETYLTMPAGEAFTVEFSEAAQGVYLEWYNLPESFTFEQLDASGNVISTDDMQPFFNCYYPVTENTKAVRVSFEAEVSLSGVWVYGASAALPDTVQQWQATPEQADLMIVSATAETLLSEFSTVIANYTLGHEIPTAIVVMANGTRTAEAECLDWLWDIGVVNHPMFGGFESDNNELYKMTVAMWRRNTTSKYINAAVESLTPKVLVTHIDDETASLGAAQFTGEYVRAAAKKFDVPKLYMSSANGTTLLPTDVPIVGAGGLTAVEVAEKAYGSCVSQHPFAPSITPNAAFLLAETFVEQDSANDDLFENIDTATLLNYVDPTPTPEPTLAPTPTPEPTPEPTAQPVAADVDDSEGGQGVRVRLPLTVLLKLIPVVGGGMVLTILVLLITYDAILKKYRRRRRRKKGKRVALWVGLAPFLASLVAGAVICVLSLEKIEVPAPATGSALSEPAAQTEPTAIPEEEALLDGDGAVGDDEGTDLSGQADGADGEAVEATALISGGDAEQYFRRAEDPEEFVSVDVDNGHWEYRTDTLSIIIDRHEADGPVVYFVAHIRMRNTDSFRTAQYADKRDGEGLGKPWIISRRNKAVLLITGDNLVHMDTEYKSILIRDGKVFQDEYREPVDTMAMYPDMTMRLYPKLTTNASQLLQDGVRQAFSFGPTLVRDGAVCENLDTGRLKTINPRTGIGMVEPGHFVAIVVDGRQETYSIGMLLSDFAQLFADENCAQAYNLDGGVSTCMVFMGEQLNHHGKRQKNDRADDTYQRRIPDALIWGYSEQVPTEDDPIYNTGELT